MTNTGKTRKEKGAKQSTAQNLYMYSFIDTVKMQTMFLLAKMVAIFFGHFHHFNCAHMYIWRVHVCVRARPSAGSDMSKRFFNVALAMEFIDVWICENERDGVHVCVVIHNKRDVSRRAVVAVPRWHRGGDAR